jgi:hypothetical protein
VPPQLLDYFDKLTNKWATSEDLTIRRCEGLRYQLNKKESKCKYTSNILPISVPANPNIDIVFVHGHQSNPIYPWAIHKKNKDLLQSRMINRKVDSWISQMLMKEDFAKNARILAVHYGTYQMIDGYETTNTPYHTFDEIKQIVFK